MNEETYVLTHDVGTTSNKTCLYRLGKEIELVESALADYPLYTLPNGGVEQDADDWWAAISSTTRSVMQRSGIDSSLLKGMAFCAQMQAFVPVNREGNVLRNPMIYLDHRATAQIERGLYHGFPRIQDWNTFKTVRSLQITGRLSASVKDPIWKYHWMRDNESHLFRRLHKWLDVNDYLILRSTGVFSMGMDSAHVTFMCNTRPGKVGWSEPLCELFDVDVDHLALDEIGVYLQDHPYGDEVGLVENLYDFINSEVEATAPGAGGLIFTPWLHGNRSPFEDPYARGMFFNIGLETGKREMIRAVLEGVAYHQRWMLEHVEKKVPYQETLRFVGGGAKKPSFNSSGLFHPR
jgi:sugar (pentulose or hexulose) kinase